MGLSWYIRRLKAMSPAEVAYRISQKWLIARERNTFAEKRSVFEFECYGAIPQADLYRLGLNFSNNEYLPGMEIELLGNYRYRDYRKRWHSTFQGESDWPIHYATDYNYGSDDVPGDIRTNWELNRHFQFTLLAKSFFATREHEYLDELKTLFKSWNDANPFMWGPEWSSPMESSIRLLNWLAAAAFLEASEEPEALDICRKLCDGAFIMAANIRRHYSRFSSANNHTIVEAAGVAIAACVFGRSDWKCEALSLLEREVRLQTWQDGVNKEQALHYQLFVMEALCLVSHALKTSGTCLSLSTISSLRSMARYAAVCRVGASESIEFGDNDEGIIFNPCVKKPFYLGYVLAFASLEFAEGERWSDDFSSYEQVLCLYSKDELTRVRRLPLFKPSHIESFSQGGITVVRSSRLDAILAFDHGPLGFGPLAAHGHADALSVQLFVNDEAVFIDPGTFIYNGNLEARNAFRSTLVHNTVTVGNKNQSEVLGPFLWGKRASVYDFSIEQKVDNVSLQAKVSDYTSNVISRSIFFSDGKIVVADDSGDVAATATFMTALPVARTSCCSASIVLANGDSIVIKSDSDLMINKSQYSPSYGITAPCWLLSFEFYGKHLTSLVWSTNIDDQ